MADPRFYSASGPFSLKELAEISGAKIAKGADKGAGAKAKFADVQPLDNAGPKHVSFLDNKRYIEKFSKSSAGACLVHPDHKESAPKKMALLLSDEPYRAYAKIAAAFYPPALPRGGAAKSATVAKTATLGKGTKIEAGVVIGAKAEIGAGCHIGANTVIGAGVVIGKNCAIGPNVSLEYCLIGDRVTIHAGASVGQDGFGFAPGGDGHLKVPQLGRVLIEDDVDIGANTAIARGSGPDTVIGAGTKIDNLVQIAHNVKLGKHCMIVSQAGISGSTEIGDFVMLGGKAGLSGHLKVGAGARIAAKAGVMGDIPPGATVGGFPARPLREWLRGVAVLRRLSLKGEKESQTNDE